MRPDRDIEDEQIHETTRSGEFFSLLIFFFLAFPSETDVVHEREIVAISFVIHTHFDSPIYLGFLSVNC